LTIFDQILTENGLKYFEHIDLRQRWPIQMSQGPHLYKIDSLKAKLSDNFNDFVDFSGK
jgi:hypothetical protein